MMMSKIGEDDQHCKTFIESLKNNEDCNILRIRRKKFQKYVFQVNVRVEGSKWRDVDSANVKVFNVLMTVLLMAATNMIKRQYEPWILLLQILLQTHFNLNEKNKHPGVKDDAASAPSWSS